MARNCYKKNGLFHMWYSKENKVGTIHWDMRYKNGINWKRKDNLINFFKSKKG